MNRWDFDCQECGCNIGDAYDVDSEWYQCSHEQKYYRPPKMIKHDVKGRGRGRVGYCYCTKCAEKLEYKCVICGNILVKVNANDHPGGNGWGIRDGVNKREPSPMSSMLR